MMQLDGQWLAAKADNALRRGFAAPVFDDSGWQAVNVPGHWCDEPAFASFGGPLLYRKRFEHPTVGPGRRAWLVLEGIFYQSDVWLDGSYLGDTEGYFFPHVFEVTPMLSSRSEHVLGIEVACETPADRAAKTALTGVFGDWDGIDPGFNPGGIWAPVRAVETGPVRLCSLQATCRQANKNKAVLDLTAVLDSAQALVTQVSVELKGADGEVAAVLDRSQPLAVGVNKARWRLEVPDPRLWWPAGMGDQPLYDLVLRVEVAGAESDRRSLRTGLRTVHMRDLLWRVNGERVFLKGADLAPTRRELGRATPGEVEADVGAVAGGGLNLVRVHGHIARPELYQAADRFGVLVWQDMPLQWGYKRARPQAVRQAGAAVELLGHHPSIVVWCGHNEPFTRGPAWGREPVGALSWRAALRWLAVQVLPNANKSVLDHSIRRALQRADPSRPVVAASGLLPHPLRPTASHLYFGWYHGRWDGLARALRVWPALGRFVGELGAQAVPLTAGFMRQERWPELDWQALQAHYGMQKAVFDRRVPPAQYPTFESWRRATQAYQAHLVKFQVETLRRLKYRPVGGFAVLGLNDAQDAVSWSLLDRERQPKAAWAALTAACADVLVAADWLSPTYRPGQRLALSAHVVNDRREPLPGAELAVRLWWPGGERRWRFGGRAPADSCIRAARLQLRLPELTELTGPGGAWPLELDLVLRWAGGEARNSYRSLILAP